MLENEVKPQPIHVSSLADGLEIRVEPAFDFKHSEETRSDGVLKMEIKPATGLDIGLYREGKLCLSPQDNYYNLQDFESHVLREDLGNLPIEQYYRIISLIAQGIPGNLRRVYEMPDFDLLSPPIDLSEREYLVFDKNLNKLRVSNLFLLDDSLIDADLVRRFWMRQYPKKILRGNLRFPDKLKGNVFSIFFVNPEVFDYDRPFEEIAANVYHDYHDNSKLTDIARSSVHSLSYGYRMRLNGVENNEVLTLIS